MTRDRRGPGQWTVSWRSPAGLTLTGPVNTMGDLQRGCAVIGVPPRAGEGENP